MSTYHPRPDDLFKSPGMPPGAQPPRIIHVPAIGGAGGLGGAPPESDEARELRLRLERKVVALNLLCAHVAYEGMTWEGDDTLLADEAFHIANDFLLVAQEWKDKPVAAAAVAAAENETETRKDGGA